MLAPSKTAPRSACTAAGPVSWTVTPAGVDSLSWARSALTTLMLSVALAALTGTIEKAAEPSLLGTSGVPPCRPGAERRPASVSGSRVPSSAVNKTSAEDESFAGNCAWSSTTRALSDPTGKLSSGEAVRVPALTPPMIALATTTNSSATHHERPRRMSWAGRSRKDMRDSDTLAEGEIAK